MASIDARMDVEGAMEFNSFLDKAYHVFGNSNTGGNRARSATPQLHHQSFLRLQVDDPGSVSILVVQDHHGRKLWEPACRYIDGVAQLSIRVIEQSTY